MRETDPDHVLLDGTLAECDRVGDSRAHFGQKHRRHDVNVQVIADPGGKLLWDSPALVGRTRLPDKTNRLSTETSRIIQYRWYFDFTLHPERVARAMDLIAFNPHGSLSRREGLRPPRPSTTPTATSTSPQTTRRRRL